MRVTITRCDVCRETIEGVPGASIEFGWRSKTPAAHFCQQHAELLADALREGIQKVVTLLSNASDPALPGPKEAA